MVIERESKIEIYLQVMLKFLVSELNILNESSTPPFTIEDETDGGEDIEMKYVI